jgi:hypothetical protein
MNLDYLDKMIPKRWIFLVCYYLPFCYFLPFYTEPTAFYFKCRTFIDALKRAGLHQFPLTKLPDLLCILEKNALNNKEIKLTKEIISEIFNKEYKHINLNFLTSLLARFNSENNSAILNASLQRIPTKVYLEYFSSLNNDNCSERTLKWCVRLPVSRYSHEKFWPSCPQN